MFLRSTMLITSVLCTLLLFLSATAGGTTKFLKLPLVHRPSSDSHRLSAAGNRPQLPVTSAASYGSGQYLVSLNLGTPPQPLLLVADTGSDLTWAACSACRSNCSAPRASRATTFYPRHSSTFSPHHCFDSTCKLVPQPVKRVHCNRTQLHSTCRYEYSYADGSATNGFFSHETTSFNSSVEKLVKFQRFSFGCGFWNSGPSVSGPSFNGADGVLGLGRGPISFPSQLGRKFGHKFSYCLMDYTLSPAPTSYLLIGGGGRRNGSKMSYTPLLFNSLSPTFYYIGIESVIIDDVKLPISPSVWAIDDLGNGGTVVDSGTTLTFLAKPAYRRILDAFDRLVKIPRSDELTLGFDLCLNMSGVLRSSLPRLSFRLSGGSIFAPPPGNYFIDTAQDVKCLALQPVTSTTGNSVIGNLMQQGFKFEFDKDRSRLGFSRHGCALP